MRKASACVNSDIDPRNRKPNPSHQPNRQSGCAPGDEIVFESRPDEEKAGYAISWNNIFYEIDEASSKTKLISRFFKRSKFKEHDEKFVRQTARSGGSPANGGQFSASSIHIIERHQQMVEIINEQRSINISRKIQNEAIQQVTGASCKRLILNNISGSLRCGQLLGLIGPSGVGKSTLLQILSGRRTTNVKGEVYLHASAEKNLKECKLNKLSFIPQNDTHIENLTVRETLIYASKLKNNERAKELIKQNNQDNSQDASSQDASSQDGSSNATISLANTSPTNSSTDTILYSGNNSSSSSLNAPSPVDSSSVESNLVAHHAAHHAAHLAGQVNHLSAQRLAGASVHNVNLDRLETQTDSSSQSDRTAATASNDTLEVNIVNEKQSPMLLNFTHVDQYHDYLVNQIIGQLMLDTCAETFVSKCSGGQLKRLSIAIELLSEPKVIIMDEPTTGLDFSSALNCIQILKNLTINNFDPPAIIVSIHQPSSSVIKLFDKLYVLAKGGVCIYNGPTVSLVNHLKNFNFNCPTYFNPTDLMIQISCQEYGEKSFKEMISYQSAVTKQELLRDTHCLKYKYDLSRLVNDMVDVQKPNIVGQIRLLIERDFKNSARRPLLNILRFCYFTFFALFIYLTYNYDIGRFNGCYSELLNTSNMNRMNYAQRLAQLSDNSSILFFITMFLVISSIMPAALTIPTEITIFIKERSNCWYSAFTYYVAKFIADLPSYVVFPVLFTCLFYPLTQQIESMPRFLWFNVIVLLNSLITRSIGMLIGSIFLNDTLSAVFVSTCAIFPFMLSAGFLIRQSVSTWLLKPFWYLGFIRYTFGCLLIIIYGWSRCLSPALSLSANSQQAADEAQLVDNLALTGLKGIMSNYLREDEMKCLIQDNQSSNFSLFADLINECDINMSQIKSSMISNLTLGNLERYDYSFILNYFELTNDDFPSYLLNLVLIFIALALLNYFVLLYKVKRCSVY